MTYQFAISPDVHARDLSNWFIFNTRLQRVTGEAFHATVYDDFTELHRAIAAGSVDLIFANASDTALLVREHGFSPVARPTDVADEAVVVVADESPVTSLSNLPSELSVAATDAPDVERICRILLEPADLGVDGIQITPKRNYVLVAKALITGESAAGFFLQAAFDELSAVTKGMLRPLIASRIHVVSHSLLISPVISRLHDQILRALLEMSADGAGQELMAGLGAPNGWEPMSMEDAAFMTDLMDTLAS